MSRQLSDNPARPRRNRAIYVTGYLAAVVMAIRILPPRYGEDYFLVVAALPGAILLLMATDPYLFRRVSRYPYLYFVLQTALILALGLLNPDDDTWGLLFIFVGVQARHYLPFRAAIAWGGLAAILLILTFIVTMGLARGLGLGLTYVAGIVLIVSWEVLSAQAEAAHQKSQALLTQLQEAHRQLQDYAAQVEEQAAIRERDRLAHQLHDSVGQTIFAITLGAESVRLMLDKDPSAVPHQLDQLQDMTSDALIQMRSLITHWRPGQTTEAPHPPQPKS